MHIAPQPTLAQEWAQTAAAALVFWTGMELWIDILNAMRGAPLAMKYVPGHVVAVVVACGLSLVIFGGLRAVRHSRPVVRALVAVAALVVAAPTYALAMPVIETFTPMLEGGQGFTTKQLAWESVYWLVPYALWLLLTLSLENGRRERVREANLAAALVAAREAELRALHYQVNPHFLYNALNSIATLILEGRNPQAERAVLRLSTFFRTSVTRDPLVEVTLAEEIAQQRIYLELEEIRFPDCLRVAVYLPDNLARAQVPSLILQPLVENAVKHGVHAPGRETHIEIAARAEAGVLVLQVIDNGPGAAGPAGTGVGVANVRERLRTRFGATAHIEAGPHPDRGYVATLSMPLRIADDPLKA